MTVVIRDAEFYVVSTTKNLRGIIEYSRRHRVERVDIWPGKDGGAQLGITWSDDASTITDFVDSTVCREWCAKRRNFPPAKEH